MNCAHACAHASSTVCGVVNQTMSEMYETRRGLNSRNSSDSSPRGAGRSSGSDMSAAQAAERPIRAIGFLDARRGAVLLAEREVELAAHETHVPADPQTGQPTLARVLQHGLGRNVPKQLADLASGQQGLVERSRI